MGLLVNGEWKDEWYQNEDGRFVRPESRFRNRVTGTPFAPEPGRYHLYISHACPWAHRTVIARQLKGLEEVISISTVHPDMAENGWTFEKDEKATGDHLYGSRYLHQIYTRALSDYTGRVTVPVLWDRKTETIVNNESSEILRILNEDFQGLAKNDIDLYPRELREAIDRINLDVYDNINNGVYKCGFASTQEAYELAYDQLFESLDRIEKLFGEQAFLAGEFATEADWRLFTTLYRFDAVYFSHFKCNRRRITDFPHLSNYVRQLFQEPGIAETCHMDHIKRHYYRSHLHINPTGIIPKGPELGFSAPHNRGLVRYMNVR